jgi:hypothetical protein
MASRGYGIGQMLVADPGAFPHLMKNSPAFQNLYNSPDSQANMNALMTFMLQRGYRPTPSNVEAIAVHPEFQQMVNQIKTGAARAKLAALYKTANLQDHASSSSGVAPVVTSRGGGPGAPLAAPPSSPYPISVAPAPASKTASLSSSPLAAIAFRAFAPRLAMSLR